MHKRLGKAGSISGTKEENRHLFVEYDITWTCQKALLSSAIKQQLHFHVKPNWEQHFGNWRYFWLKNTLQLVNKLTFRDYFKLTILRECNKEPRV
jgi:hypothetical protein